MIKHRLYISLFIVFFSSIIYGQNIFIDSLIHQAQSGQSVDSLEINRLSTWQRVFNESKEAGSHYRIVEICTSLGDFFFNYGLYEDAIGYYTYIFSTEIDTIQKSVGLINVYRKIGQCYSYLGKPDSAYYFYNQIFNEFEFPEQLDVLRDLVEIYANNADHQKSLEYNLRIEELLLSNGSPGKEISKIYNNIGFNYHQLRQFEKGIEYFNRALFISNELTDDEESSILRNLGISHYNLGNYDQSIELLNRAYSQITEDRSRAELAHLIATVYIANTDFIRAVSFLEKAEQLAKNDSYDETLSNIYAGFANVYNATHEYDLAFEYFKDHSRLSDSLLFAEQLNQKRILDNQKYIERTEKENRLLKAQQDFQKLQISQLEIQARNQTLRNENLRADSIQRVNELVLARQENEIVRTKEANNSLEIARQKDLIELTNQQLQISRSNEEKAVIEQKNQQNENEIARQTISLQERSAQLREEKITNETAVREIEKRKTNQRNIAIIASLLAGIAILLVWAYRNKRKDNNRLTITQGQLKAAETKIKGLLKQQVSGAVAEVLMTNVDPTAVEQRFVCIMFLDIRDFTVFCEGRKPAEIIAYQNSIFGFIIDIIEEYHGVVNQLLGDGFMATFGAPISRGNDCLNAYQAANKIIKTLQKKVARKEVIDTRIGIGLHAGYVVTGNVGNEERKQYSITGNTVILAARLEQLNKEYGSTLVFSKEVYDALPENEKSPANFNPVMVKGRSKPIEVAAV